MGPSAKHVCSCCSHCGGSSHLPQDCVAKSTSTGHTPASIATNAKSKHVLLAPNGSNTALTLLRSHPAPLESTALISITVACVTMPRTEQVHALPLDPQSLVTPLNPGRVEALLHNYSILAPWSHIIAGLCHRFNVGIRGQPLRTYLFQEPFIFQPGSCLYRFIHTIRTISQSLLPSLFSFRA